MKFDEAFVEPRALRTWMPAEACSELGLTSPLKPASWFTRLLYRMRRRMRRREPRAHG